MENYDFSGWATKNDLRCSDGRTIRKDAFKDCDGKKVPLVWNHRHDENFNVLGHAMLKNKPNGVYAYCKFNDTESGKNAKMLVEHGDIVSLSIMANQLKQNGGDVLHGNIREVSLVLAGANPGAFIDTVISHGETIDDEACIFTGETLELFHVEEEEETVKEEKQEETKTGDRKISDILDELTEEQKTAVYGLIGMALEENEGGNEEDMKHNVFDAETEEVKDDVLTHSEMMEIISDAKRYGSMKESALQHGIDDVEYLFPDYRELNTPPSFIQRDTGWVAGWMNSVHKTPFSRIKTTFADITEDEARALGYMKGNKKKDEVFSLLKRTTDPQTIYKRQKMDRDDVIDITDFDVISWLKTEMRMMLDEEIARACLIGDGRLSSSDDKIKEDHIRPIWTDDDLYSIKVQFTSANDEDSKSKAFIRAAIKARKDYKGSGSPILYTTEDNLTDLLLLTDEMGRDLYDSVDKLATKLRVRQVVTIPAMEGQKRTVEGKEYELFGIIVNPSDYNIGADKGGAISMFDDFDIDYNQMKYLIETRISGALIKPKSAIVLEYAPTTASASSYKASRDSSN